MAFTVKHSHAEHVSGSVPLHKAVALHGVTAQVAETHLLPTITEIIERIQSSAHSPPTQMRNVSPPLRLDVGCRRSRNAAGSSSPKLYFGGGLAGGVAGYALLMVQAPALRGHLFIRRADACDQSVVAARRLHMSCSDTAAPLQSSAPDQVPAAPRRARDRP